MSQDFVSHIASPARPFAAEAAADRSRATSPLKRLTIPSSPSSVIYDPVKSGKGSSFPRRR
ncbi:MAG: hypothetical protein AB8I58_22925, partial [Anaerolineales bacterium]